MREVKGDKLAVIITVLSAAAAFGSRYFNEVEFKRYVVPVVIATFCLVACGKILFLAFNLVRVSCVLVKAYLRVYVVMLTACLFTGIAELLWATVYYSVGTTVGDITYWLAEIGWLLTAFMLMDIHFNSCYECKNKCSSANRVESNESQKREEVKNDK